MDLSSLGFAPVACIVVICYVVGLVAKGIKPLADNLIPVVVAVSGALLGCLGMLTIVNFASDWLSAIAIGIVSGLSSTGLNQAGKQLSALQNTEK